MNKKKKKQNIANITYTTGDPALNCAQFNKDSQIDTVSSTDASTLTEEKMQAVRLGVEVELPAHTHLLDASQIKNAIREVEPEEEFEVGYVTPVYFYKQLWDKFTLFKYTEMRGWTGEDYIEARPDHSNSSDRIALAKQQTAIADTHNANDHWYNGDGGTHANRDPLAKMMVDFSADYTLVNKIVHQAKGETLLFYPVVGSQPHVRYYIDLKDGCGPRPVSREQLEPTIFKKVEQIAFTFKKGSELRAKILNMLAIDAATVAACPFDSTNNIETRSRFNAGHEFADKPQVRALYLNQIYYLKTDKVRLGDKDRAPIGESYCESHSLAEKRETKRYYIRPQDIFCANKADVLKGLISVADAGENCTVYSLKRLDDHDDVHKLTNQDIIYYYTDNVLYDKNHVLVMDYDLFIKHEEERKKINRNPDSITGKEYANYYTDRMTKETVVESKLKEAHIDPSDYFDEPWELEDIPNYVYQQNGLNKDDFIQSAWASYYRRKRRASRINSTAADKSSVDTAKVQESLASTANISLDLFKLALERGEKVDIGSSQSNVFDANMKVNTYAKTNYVAYKDTNKYFITEILVDTDNNNTIGKLHSYDSFDELINGIQAIDWSSGHCDIELPVKDAANPLDVQFESYDVFGNRLTEDKTNQELDICCICGEPMNGYGNNADPYKEGRCCDACNYKFVIPARLAMRHAHLDQD